ncbi:ABC transporter substrate-binding protein [Sphaerobacter sp.]|uniref:ABC transporter substrate-binding protein n=1 Tax=Sphaerobacter sp. TaxID=2099654 RepID=UPI001DAAC267|nr:peptide ABC transporter substrate-binding protein [Sphaerobacter sp.]MBX5443556.1 peptide ABC transporter substrate-binding protein [Sphaerobacter sp.]
MPSDDTTTLSHVRVSRRALLLGLSVLLASCRASILGRDKATPTVRPTEPGSAGAGTESPGTGGGEVGTVLEAPPPATVADPSGEQTLTMIGSPDGPATLDPALVRDTESAFVTRQIFRGLVRLDEQLQPVPDLARRIEISPDGLTYTFFLWEDITFANGRRITAEDVRYSLERATDPALAGGHGETLPAGTYLADIAGAADRLAGRADSLRGVEVLDQGTVRITLEHPTTNFLLKLAATPGYVVDRENARNDGNWWKKPNGSGPFNLAEWREQERIVLEAHPGYTPNPPTLERVVILIGTEALQPVAMYEQGEVDVADVGLFEIDRLQAPNSPLREELHVQPLFAVSYVLFNPNVPPLDNPDLRRALLQGFDRHKIATVTYDGHVTPVDGILPPGLLGRDWPAEVPAYDPEAARALLDRAVGSERPTVSIYTTGAQAPVAMKQVYQRDLGLPVEVLQLDFTDYINELGTREMPATSLTWVADFPDPDTFLRALFYSTSPDNPIGYRNPEVDRLLDEARGETDPERRAALFQQVQQTIIDDAVVVPLYAEASLTLIKPYVHGMTLTPLGILGLETVWMTL